MSSVDIRAIDHIQGSYTNTQRIILQGIEGDPVLDIDLTTLQSDDIIFISGSRIAGFGNRRSDVDVFVITQDRTSYLYNIPRARAWKQYYIDYEVYSINELRKIAKVVNASPIANYDSVLSISATQLDIYSRTVIGTAVHGHAGFAALQSDFSADRLAATYAIWCAARSGPLMSLASLAWTKGLSRLASYFARNGAAYAAEYLAAQHGETYVSRKWIFEKLKRAIGSDTSEFQDTLRVLLEDPAPRDIYLRQAREYCERYAGGPWQTLGLDVVMPERITDSTIVMLSKRRWLVLRGALTLALTRVMNHIWDLCDGSRSLADILYGGGTDVDELASAMWSLYLAGAITLRIGATNNVKELEIT